MKQIAQQINRLHAEVDAINSSIDDIEVEIKEHEATVDDLHAQAETKETDAQGKAEQVGRLLIEAKKRRQHGTWLNWLKENCPEINERTARQYMSYVRGDTDSLHSGAKRSRRAEGSDLPQNGDLTETQRIAIEGVKQGKSYRQIGKDLGKDESIIRKDPVIRQAHQEANGDDYETVVTYGACQVRLPPDVYKLMKSEIEILFKMPISKQYRTRFRNLWREALEQLDNMEDK